ncbi:serine protease [Abortiporus biennis]|nr:serine protease [Abortiporus biennis]
MRFFSVAAATLALLAAPIFGAPTDLKPIEKYQGKVKQGSYIVKLKDNVAKDHHLAWLIQHLNGDSVTHTEWQKDTLNGFAGRFSENTLNLLRSSPDVEYISEDGIVSINAVTTQTNAPWGIARLSQNAKLSNQNTGALTFSYKYDSAAGAGVDIYVVDTGIFTSHSQFGGRARWGATFGGYPDADGNGHGTHVSGTAAGSQFGVAKSANLIAVKVLDDSGSGSVSDIVSGLNWVITQARSSGRPSIATLSLGGGASTALDNAIASVTSAGIHVTVAAGNSNVDAGSTSPARAPSANTIGATTIADARASFSNFGSVVDLWAPGQNIISAWIGSTTATNNISGTSMATPHVAGLIAYLISVEGNDTPAAISSKLKSLSVKGVITGIPSGTINDLARNDQ